MFLSTVRRKLTALVGISALSAFAVLPLIWWLMHRGLVEEVHARVPGAVHGFIEELDDDVKDLDVTVRALAESPAAERALAARDSAALAKRLAPAHEAYPDLDFIFYDPSGALVMQEGCDHPQPQLPKVAIGKHLVLPHGCEAAETAPVAFAMIRPIGEAGFVLVCLPLDQAYFANAQAKIGAQLALQFARGEAPLGVQYATPRFPGDAAALATSHGRLVDDGDQTWVVTYFVPEMITTAELGDVHVRFLVALDVTAAKALVRKHIAIAFAIVLAATIAALAFGWRLSSRMVSALSRVNAAMRRLEAQEYVKVEAVRTGDELEDLAEGFNQMVDGLQERDKLRTTMGKYMTSEVLEHVMAGEVELGGKSLDVTILFCDLRDFTTLSEKRSAHEIVGLLNEYFTVMVDVVMSEGGVVDKYIGDNIMAVFGAPVSRPDDALRAVRAAVKMRDALVALNARFAERGLPPLRFGIGLHTGEVVAGNIGSARRMEYTVIGDAVNLASRLESKTKELGTDILISDATYQQAKVGIEAEASGEIKVKGREQAVAIYKVTAVKA